VPDGRRPGRPVDVTGRFEGASRARTAATTPPSATPSTTTVATRRRTAVPPASRVPLC